MADSACETYDCIVVGGGHAGSCAALEAKFSGCKRVLILEKAPKSWAGGNGYFTAGAFRTVHGGLTDLLPIIRNVSPEITSTIDMDPYLPADFTHDLMRLSDNRSDPALAHQLVNNSRDTIEWLAQKVGVSLVLSFNRQAYQINGRQKFWGGMVLGVEEGGKGLIADHHRALEKAGIEIWYDTPALQLLSDGESVIGINAKRGAQSISLKSSSVILASGGFEASAELRAKYLGEEWSKARVRGTPHNTGDGLSLAVALGAKLTGDWSSSGCHSTCWDANAPFDHGDRELSNQFTKSGYPLGLMLNAEGKRFVDEAADFRNYTYAKYGRATLFQPGGIAFQIYDAQVTAWLRSEEYDDNVVKKVYADSIEELAEMLVPEGLTEPRVFIETIESYNSAVEAHRAENLDSKWDPAVKDGLSTVSTTLNIQPPKSNWALALYKPPFLAVKVACGITFTFGGLAINPETAAVLSERDGKPIPGLFCTGELVGGLFFGNYPGGSGLTAGAVFGRKAGKSAALRVKHISGAINHG